MSRFGFLPFCILLNFLALSGIQVFAQDAGKPVYVYLSTSRGTGTANYGFVELHTQFLERHDVSIGYSAFNHKARSTPDDYDRSTILGLGMFPQDFLDGITATYCYLLYPKQGELKTKLRYPVGIGALIGTYSEPGNFHESGGWFGPNYDYDDIRQTGFAVILRGGLEFTPGRVFGLNAGGFVVVGNMTGAGIYAGMMLGKVSSHRSKRHR